METPKIDKPQIILTIRFKKMFFNRLKTFAEREGVSMASVIRKALENYGI